MLLALSISNIYICTIFSAGSAFRKLGKLVIIEKNEALTIARLQLIGGSLLECLVSVPFVGVMGGFFIFFVPCGLLLGLVGFLLPSGAVIPAGIRLFSVLIFPVILIEIVGRFFKVKKRF